MKYRVKSLAFATAALALAALPAAAQTKWNLPSAYPIDNPHLENIGIFAKDVSEATGGKLTISVHAGASLFKGPEIKRAVATGQAQTGEILISILENESPIFGIDVVPFLATSFPEAKKLWAASKPADRAEARRAGHCRCCSACRGGRRASTPRRTSTASTT